MKYSADDVHSLNMHPKGFTMHRAAIHLYGRLKFRTIHQNHIGIA